MHNIKTLTLAYSIYQQKTNSFVRITELENVWTNLK